MMMFPKNVKFIMEVKNYYGGDSMQTAINEILNDDTDVLIEETAVQYKGNVGIRPRKLRTVSFEEEKQSNSISNKIYNIAKRAFDVSICGFSLIMLAPLFLIVSIAIKLDSKGKVFYKHKRIGKNGIEFSIYKFRTMICTNKKLEELLTPEQLIEYKINFKVDNDPRITKLGQFLRKTSIDEIPQLINILKGEMSIVGPRPVLQEETEMYGKDRNLFLSVLPGLTGYWQANGRSNTTYQERIDMELYYVKNKSFLMDIFIIFKTAFVVIARKGAK